MKGFGDLDNEREISNQEILINLMDGEHDLDLKTEVLAPKELSVLKVIAWVLGIEGLPKSKETLDKFIDFYERYMVSFKRKGREEVVQALSSLFDKETIRMSISDKLTSNLKK